MRILLIEDEKEHCRQYNQYISTLIGIDLYITDNCEKALLLTIHQKPDIILLDLEMHYGYGDGILYLKELSEIAPLQKPIIIVITKITSSKTHNIARKFGADYIFVKGKPDYSAKMIIDWALLTHAQSEEKSFVEPLLEKSSVLRDRISSAIASVGITNDMNGREYIIDAIEIAVKAKNKNLRITRDIYPIIAEKYDKTTYSIDSSISTAIKKAWRLTDLDVLQKNYKSSVRYTTGTPTNKEFIFYFRDKLKT